MARRIALLAFLLLCEGCLLRSPSFELPTPGDVSSIDARLARDSADVDAVVARAALDLSEGRPEIARSLLASADRRIPGDPVLPFLLAIALEEAGLPSEARRTYEEYAGATLGVLARRAETRSAVLQPRATREDLRRTLTEPLTSRAAPSDRTVAVLPFAHAAGDADAGALAAAAAAIVGMDVSSDRDPVDDVRLRILLDEMNADPSLLDDIALGVEVGQRLGAAHVVQVRPQLETDGIVLWEVSIATIGRDSLEVVRATLEGSPTDIPSLTRRLSVVVRQAFRGEVFRDPLAPARTENQEALLAFGRGLRALDQDDLGAARDAFAAASEADETFVEAAALETAMSALLTERSTPLPDVLRSVARVGERQRAVMALRGTGSTHLEAVERVGARQRGLVSDLLGLDAVGGSPLVEITFTPPGTTP